MHRRRPLALFVALMLTPAAMGQPSVVGNAAVDYWRGMYALQKTNLQAVRDLDWSKIGDAVDPAALPKELKDAAACLTDAALDDLQLGAGRSRCDFQIQYERGPMALLPHLAAMRDAARVLRASARVKLAEGDAAAAANRLGIILHMSDHLRADKLLISNLVAIAMVNLAAEETRVAIDSKKLTPEARRALAQDFHLFTVDDPFGIKRSIIGGERDTCLLWVKKTFRGEHAGRDLAQSGLLWSGSSKVDSDPSVRAIVLMNGAQVDAAVDLAYPYYEQAIAVWDDADAEQKLGALEQKVQGGAFGPLAKIVAPSLVKCHQSDLKGRRTVHGILERLAE
jgi:hypothetical protein